MGDVRPGGDLPPTVGLGQGGIDLVDWRTKTGQFEVRATERLRALVLQESPSGNIELLKQVRDDLAREWKSLGMTVGIVPGPAGDHLVGSFAGRPQGSGGGSADRGHLLVVSHYDTVWPPGELARQPFRVDGKYVAGPGTFDMKGGIVAFEVALSLLRGPARGRPRNPHRLRRRRRSQPRRAAHGHGPG